MNKSLNLSKKRFAVYGLGITGKSVVNYFRKVGFRNYIMWDDDKSIRKDWKLEGKKRNNFYKLLDSVDYIIISPGISPKKIRKILSKNISKIITDLDLFFMLNPKVNSIVVTGTNGKSTTCKVIEHVLKKNNFNTVLGGNIGKPALTLNLKKNPLVVIEASSFHLAYSKFVKPNYGMILNISNDHIDWHGSMKNYINSKLKIFSLQDKNNFAFIDNKSLLKKYKKKKFLGKLVYLNSNNYKKIKNRIKNNYLNSKVNIQNMSFVHAISKKLGIRDKYFVNSLKTFKGLPHRYEIFFKKNNKTFINDSKATSFQASKFALEGNKNIFWIVGGVPKIRDKFKLDKIKQNIIKTYIIGNHMKTFRTHLMGEVKFELSRTIKNAIISISRDIKNIVNKKITVLLSPASASYDQFKNFEDRGNKFKKLVKSYARKYF